MTSKVTQPPFQTRQYDLPVQDPCTRGHQKPKEVTKRVLKQHASLKPPVTSSALVLYDPQAHPLAKATKAADKAFRRSFEVTKFETRHLPVLSRIEVAKYEIERLSPRAQLAYLAQHLPEVLPMPFSGVIAFQLGEGPIIQACHYSDQIAFTVDQPFNALSIGKVFTATAVMQLIEAGKFSLDTPLSKLLGEDELDVPLKPPYESEKPEPSALAHLKMHADKITLGHLLSHRAGFVERPEDRSKGIAEGNSWDLNHIGKESYSNYGYQLLGRIVGKHSPCRNISILDHERGFRSHIEERIFKPAGMRGAIREMHSPTKNMPGFFEISKEGTRERIPSTTKEPYPHGNGCWRMTVGDLFAFKRAMHQPKVLMSEKSFRTLRDHPSGHLGLQVQRHPMTGYVMGYGHPGGGPGMSSFIHTWRTDPPVTAVVLANYSGCQQVKPEFDKFI